MKLHLVRGIYAQAGTLAAATTLGMAGRALAANTFDDSSQINPNGKPDFSSGSGDIRANIANIATYVLNIVLLISGIAAVFFLIYSGIQYITSAGNPEKIKLARAGIINAVIGIIIIVAAYFIIKVAVNVGGSLSSRPV